MCPLIFTRGISKRRKPTSLHEHRLSPLRTEGSSHDLPPSMPGEAPSNLPFQHEYLVASGSAQTASGDTDNHQPEAITVNVLPLPSVGPLPENTQEQRSPQYQEGSEINSLTATRGPNERSDWWYCHVCRNGPQGIQTPSCTGMTASGICGHQRCDLCSTE